MSDWKGTKALVTGGAGLIGSHVADMLLEGGADVTILDNLEPQTHPEGKPAWIPKEARFVHGHMQSMDDLKKAVKDIDVVFHQAAFGGFTSEASKYFDANATGTARLYEALAEEGHCRRVVAASSQAVYGEGLYACADHGEFHPREYRKLEDLKKGFFELRCPQCGQASPSVPLREDTEHLGETPYALSKDMEERTVLAFGKKYGIPSTALRYAVTFGPRQSIFNPYTGVVSIFSTRILNDMPPVVYEDGNQTRDYIFVKDIAAANLFLARSEGAVGKALNVGTGRAVTVKELVATLNELYGKSVEPLVRGFRPGDVRHIRHDVSTLNALGFKAKYSLKDGLKEHAAWVESLGSVKEYFDKAEEHLRKHGVVLG